MDIITVLPHSPVLSIDLKIRGIAIAPGATDTAMLRQGKADEDIQQIIDMTPLKRVGQPEDIANTVVFLLSDQGSWINGQIIHCNGGII